EPRGEAEPDSLARLGYAEGYARRGDLVRARELAQTRGPAEDRLKALAAVAAVALGKDRNDTTDLQTALELVKEAQGRSATSGPLWRLARAAARAGQVKLAQDLAAAIPDPVLRGRAQLEIFRARLKNSNDRIDF